MWDNFNCKQWYSVLSKNDLLLFLLVFMCLLHVYKFYFILCENSGYERNQN